MTFTVRPPSDAELDALKGRIVVLVVIDEEDADDTIEGELYCSCLVGSVSADGGTRHQAIQFPIEYSHLSIRSVTSVLRFA